VRFLRPGPGEEKDNQYIPLSVLGDIIWFAALAYLVITGGRVIWVWFIER
jgi:membrane protein DedA with SNARE-associated domain